jgi:hypothetical protein
VTCDRASHRSSPVCRSPSPGPSFPPSHRWSSTASRSPSTLPRVSDPAPHCLLLQRRWLDPRRRPHLAAPPLPFLVCHVRCCPRGLESTLRRRCRGLLHCSVPSRHRPRSSTAARCARPRATRAPGREPTSVVGRCSRGPRRHSASGPRRYCVAGPQLDSA